MSVRFSPGVKIFILTLVVAMLVILTTLYKLLFPTTTTPTQPREMFNTLSCVGLSPVKAKTIRELGERLNDLASSSPRTPPVFCITKLKSGTWEIYRGSIK